MRTPVRFAILVLLLCSMTSCAWLPKWARLGPTSPGNSQLVGIWKHKTGALWAIRADGGFDVDLNRDAAADITGVYRLRGDQMTISNTGGESMPGCEWPGVYQYKLSNDKLRFNVVEDACTERVILLTTAVWRRQ